MAYIGIPEGMSLVEIGNINIPFNRDQIDKLYVANPNELRNLLEELSSTQINWIIETENTNSSLIDRLGLRKVVDFLTTPVGEILANPLDNITKKVGEGARNIIAPTLKEIVPILIIGLIVFLVLKQNSK